jgi:hypothetical protein
MVPALCSFFTSLTYRYEDVKSLHIGYLAAPAWRVGRNCPLAHLGRWALLSILRDPLSEKVDFAHLPTCPLWVKIAHSI